VNNRGTGILFPCGQDIILALKCPHKFWFALVSCCVGTGTFLPCVKRTLHETDEFPAAISGLEIVWSCSSTPLHDAPLN